MSDKLKISLILGAMCIFLSMGIVVQINTVGKSITTVGKTLVENELRDSVLRWQQKYENAYKSLEKKDEELNILRERVESRNENYTGLSSRLKNYNSLLGNTEVVGNGIIITLDDGDSSLLKGLATNYIVHDEDILETVNALKNVGAEAISINDQRVVSTTSITCAGNIVMINGERIGVPYVIKAIGLPSKLYGAVTMPGGYIENIQRQGVNVTFKQVEDGSLLIPKYEGVYKFEYATIFE